jgi:hypothetical protein
VVGVVVAIRDIQPATNVSFRKQTRENVNNIMVDAQRDRTIWMRVVYVRFVSLVASRRSRLGAKNKKNKKGEWSLYCRAAKSCIQNSDYQRSDNGFVTSVCGAVASSDRVLHDDDAIMVAVVMIPFSLSLSVADGKQTRLTVNDQKVP